MRSMSFLIICFAWFSVTLGKASAEWPTHIEKSVTPGGSVVVFKVNHYQNVRGCTASPAGTIDGDPKPKFGSLYSDTKVIEGNGPCGKMEYNIQTIGYKAGTVAGTEEFTLYLYPGGWPGGSASQIKIKISVGGRSSAPPPKQAAPDTKSKAVSQSEKPKTSPKKQLVAQPTTNELAGIYVNNLGNSISIEGDFLYFTGMWSGEKVQRKTFAIGRKSEVEFVWAMYECESNNDSFTCKHRGTKLQLVYKKVPRHPTAITKQLNEAEPTKPVEPSIFDNENSVNSKLDLNIIRDHLSPSAASRKDSTTGEANQQPSTGSSTANTIRMAPALWAKLDALMQKHYKKCWSFDAKPTTRYVPQILVQYTQNGVLAINPVLLNPPRDPNLRPFAEGALRAMHRCDPLPITAEFAPYHMEWKKRILRFDPDEMN